MRRIYTTITKRFPKVRGPDEEWRGCLAVLDWDAQRVLSQHWIAFTQGPLKGEPSWCRGLAVHEGRLCVAVSPGTIQYRNLDTLAVEDEVVLPGVEDVHEIKEHHGDLYVVNSGHNELVVVRDRGIVARRTVLTPNVERFVYTHRRGVLDVDKIHFNAIGWMPNGHEIHIYNSAFMIYDATISEPLWLGHPLAGPHDLCFVSRRAVLVNCSSVSCTYIFDLVRHLFFLVYHAEEQAAIQGPEYAAAGWTRGLATHGTSAFVGVSPSEVVEVDFRTTEVRRQLKFSEDPREAPYFVLLDPRDWV